MCIPARLSEATWEESWPVSAPDASPSPDARKSLVPAQAGLVDEQTGQLPGTRAAFLGASLATGLGGILGTSPVIILNETCAVAPTSLLRPQPRSPALEEPGAQRPLRTTSRRGFPNHLQVRRNRRGW